MIIILVQKVLLKNEEKLQLLRDKNTAYLNNFSKKHNANDLHKSYDELSKEELESNPVEGINCCWKDCSEENYG